MRFIQLMTVFGMFFLVASEAKAEVAAEDECEMPELFGVSCVEPDLEEIAKHDLGSFGNPVRVDKPEGQRAYLMRLICSNGNFVDFGRSGSAGVGPYGFIVDAYSVSCGPEEENQTLYLDMYHPGFEEKNAPPGFTLYE